MVFFFFLFFFSLTLFSKEEGDCLRLFSDPKEEAIILAPLRAKAIRGWDRLFAWTLRVNHTPYPLLNPLEERTFVFTGEKGKKFSEGYNYFSIYRPLVGVVSSSKRDIQITRCLLSTIALEIQDPAQLRFATDEVLAKVLAYRDLEKGMAFAIPDPNEQNRLQTYVVADVLNLWRGMPAFILVPEEGRKAKTPPLVLFRGTDLSLSSEKGWASILSDLDPKGVGYTTFLKAKDRLGTLFSSLYQHYGPIRLLGYSLGGAFALYSMIYFPTFFTKEIAFASAIYNPPGLSKYLFQKWQILETEEKPSYLLYLNEGDLVSKLGLLPKRGWQVKTERLMEVIESHVTLMFAQDKYTLSAVDMGIENQRRDEDFGRGP